jgi:hypothetical protein
MDDTVAQFYRALELANRGRTLRQSISAVDSPGQKIRHNLQSFLQGLSKGDILQDTTICDNSLLPRQILNLFTFINVRPRRSECLSTQGQMGKVRFKRCRGKDDCRFRHHRSIGGAQGLTSIPQMHKDSVQTRLCDLTG